MLKLVGYCCLMVFATAILLALTGCAGLSVNFDFNASYRSDVELGSRNK